MVNLTIYRKLYDIRDKRLLKNCNITLDGLLKKLDELERTSQLYRGLIDHTRSLLKSIFELSTCHKAFGDVFASIGAREQQLRASEAFTKFGEAHRQIDRYAHGLMKTLKPVRNHTTLSLFLSYIIPNNRFFLLHFVI